MGGAVYGMTMRAMQCVASHTNFGDEDRALARAMTPRSELIVPENISPFAVRGSTDEVEEGRAFAPKFDADGLVTCVATDARSGEVLMVAHMNAEALAADHRDRRGLVLQPLAPRPVAEGRSSGHVQRVVEMRIDCDQDAVWIRVEQEGPGACHTGRRSCFYRAVPLGKSGAVTLEFRDGEKTFDPEAVYGGKRGP